MSQAVVPKDGLLQHVYGFCYARGFLNASWFQRIFARAYFFYKRYFEDIYHPLLKRYPQLIAQGHVLDVGANIGYTSILFAKKISGDRKVHSFEPAPLNFKILHKECAHLKNVVLNPVAVGSTPGNIELWINPTNHGDHRVITAEFAKAREVLRERVLVPLITMDDYCQEKGILNHIGFVKIDVQGPEFSVLQGMEKILAANPDIFISLEYYPAGCVEMGGHPDEILDFLEARGFCIYAVDPKGKLFVTTRTFFNDANIQSFANRPYVDIVAGRTKKLVL